MRVTGENFVPPSTPSHTNSLCESRDSDCESEPSTSDESNQNCGRDWRQLLSNMFSSGTSYENDPDPYELAPGYEPINPLYPDRRYWLGSEPNIVTFEGESNLSMWDDNCYPLWERRGLPMVIEGQDFSLRGYQRWLSQQLKMWSNNAFEEDMMKVVVEPEDPLEELDDVVGEEPEEEGELL